MNKIKKDNRVGKQLVRAKPKCLECGTYLKEDVYIFRDDNEDKYIWVCHNCGSEFIRIIP